MEFPFPPFLGLEVSWECGGYAVIQKVQWLSTDLSFELFCGHHFMDTGNPDHDFHNFERWVEAESEIGWEVSKVMRR
jgi:hypothetical protein